jgi:hypothetical protein
VYVAWALISTSIAATTSLGMNSLRRAILLQDMDR